MIITETIFALITIFVISVISILGVESYSLEVLLQDDFITFGSSML